MNEQSADVVVVGAGILGLAHAYVAAKSGKRVTVFERHAVAAGASVANFGMLWPIGQPAGPMLQLAMASRSLWLGVLQQAAIPFAATGSLHAACQPDEVQVGREFAELAPDHGFQCQWLTREQALDRSPALRADTVQGALWSASEIMVDPREVLRRLPTFLAERYAVNFHWATPVLEVGNSRVHTTKGTWQASRILVCSGADFETLYPELFDTSGLTRCKLQMLRTAAQPNGWRLGPALAGGLTFRFYPSFALCPSLPALRERIASERPAYDELGIHTMVSQSATGQLTLGDSHEYGLSPSPFNLDLIDRLIIEHLHTYLRVPDLSIAERWYGVYSKHFQKPYVRFNPEAAVDVVTGLGGAGMTLSFGVAAETWKSSPQGGGVL